MGKESIQMEIQQIEGYHQKAGNCVVGSAKIPPNATNGTTGCIKKDVTCINIVLLQLAREMLLAQNIVLEVGFKFLFMTVLIITILTINYSFSKN